MIQQYPLLDCSCKRTSRDNEFPVWIAVLHGEAEGERLELQHRVQILEATCRSGCRLTLEPTRSVLDSVGLGQHMDGAEG